MSFLNPTAKLRKSRDNPLFTGELLRLFFDLEFHSFAFPLGRWGAMQGLPQLLELFLEPLSDALPVDGKYELACACAYFGGDVFSLELTLVFLRI